MKRRKPNGEGERTKTQKAVMTVALRRTTTVATTDAMTVGIAEATIGTTITARIHEIVVTTAEIIVRGAEVMASMMKQARAHA